MRGNLSKRFELPAVAEMFSFYNNPPMLDQLAHLGDVKNSLAREQEQRFHSAAHARTKQVFVQQFRQEEVLGDIPETLIPITFAEATALGRKRPETIGFKALY